MAKMPRQACPYYPSLISYKKITTLSGSSIRKLLFPFYYQQNSDGREHCQQLWQQHRQQLLHACNCQCCRSNKTHNNNNNNNNNSNNNNNNKQQLLRITHANDDDCKCSQALKKRADNLSRKKCRKIQRKSKATRNR